MDNLNARAEIDVVLKGIKQAQDGLQDLMDKGSKDADRLSRSLATVEARIAAMGGVSSQSSAGVRRLSGAQLELAERLYSQSRAYRDISAATKIAVGNEKAQSRAAAEAVAGIDRMSAAYDKRIAAEGLLDRQRRTGIQTTRQQMSAWDAEFKALEKASSQSDALATKNLPRLRYALYDVATTAGIVATAIAGVGTASAFAFASTESAFSNVERTLNTVDPTKIAALREELMGLTREMPLAFGDVAEIATLGNQLGIAEDQVAKFAETVTQASVAFGMTPEATAMAFGSLGDLLNVAVADYDKLGSSIAFVGRLTRATEPEIVSMSQRLAASATRAGFTADQVVGLSAAFASLRIAPERAQGVMEVYFNRLNTAIAEGGPRLEAFGAVAGVAAGEVEGLVRSDPVGFFSRLADGLGRLDSIAQTRALEQLGLDGIRAGEVFGRVAGNADTLFKSMQFANQGFAEGTDLARQYGILVDDLASKWQIFMNAVTEAGSAVGAILAPALGFALETLTNLLNGFVEFVNTPFGAGLTTVVTVLGAIVAGLAGLIAAGALARASLAAMQTAMLELGIQSAFAAGGLRGVIAMLLGVGPAASGAAVGLRLLKIALITTGVGALIVGLGYLVGLLLDFGGTLKELQPVVEFAIDLFVGLARSVVAALRIVSDAIGSLPGAGIFKDWADGLQVAFDEMGNFGRDAKKEFGNFVRDNQRAADSTKDFNDALDDFSGYGLDALEIMDGLGDAAAGAARQVRTLVDYANDLSGVFKRAFDIRFGPQQGLDSITTGWSTIAKNIAAAREEMAQYRIELGQLAADRAIKQYWLMVAENYGDTLRAQKLRAELAELDGKQADIQKKLNAAQAKTNKTLTGNSDATAENRAEILGLVTNYQNYLQALAASGASQEELQRESARLRAEFVQQATRMGYNRTEVEKYAAAFDDMRIAIQNVPRNITVTANVNPAIQALNEFKAQAAAVAKSGVNVPLNLTSSGISQQFKDALFVQWLQDMRNKHGVSMYSSAAGLAKLRADWERGLFKGFADGGYTGRGGKYDVAGLVHKGEYVVPKKYVDQRTGLPYASAFNALTRGPAGQTGYAGGGFVQPPRVINAGTGRIESFGPMAYQQLQAALRQIITVDGHVVAQAAANNFARSTAQGAY